MEGSEEAGGGQVIGKWRGYGGHRRGGDGMGSSQVSGMNR